ncbi:MAG: type II toxin-antitoxin system RelE/ParE family toxin [Pseudomonadota bacterium]
MRPELQAKFIHVSELILKFGPMHVGMPHIRPLGDKLWEIRVKAGSVIARSIYTLSENRTVLILHTFVKKTQKTPQKAIRKAQKRMKEV